MFDLQELLPETKSSRNNFVQYSPDRKTVLIELDRKRSEYRIRRLPAEGGDAYCFSIVGREYAEPNHYDVFVAGRPDLQDSCGCHGFLGHGHCKHTAALRALLENQWL